MIYSLENDYFKIDISTKGAELQSIFSKKLGVELLWQGDANFWGKRSPILFPIVGSLKNGEYEYQDKKYNLPRHGFARDMEFEFYEEIENEREGKSINFVLMHTVETLKKYPFEFRFEMLYTLFDDALLVEFKVKNTSGDKPMYVSFGAHPAFNLPIFPNTNFEDYSLIFNTNETSGIFPLTNDGLIKANSIPFFKRNNKIKLHKELFYADALVFKYLQSDGIKLIHNESKKGFNFGFTSNFDFFGIWSAKNAPFICLEPWAGIADSEKTNGKLINKEGIIKLSPEQETAALWRINALLG
ncbi:MAG: aldose 1-epimerase family protein [Chitinophagaceae bacterium]